MPTDRSVTITQTGNTWRLEHHTTVSHIYMESNSDRRVFTATAAAAFMIGIHRKIQGKKGEGG